MIRRTLPLLLALALAAACSSTPPRANRPPEGSVDRQRIAELDAYWAEVSRTVREGDFEGYAATCHEEGVLVAGISGRCHPLREALARWKQEFVDTKAGRRKSDVVFRFRRRLGDAATAHETGIFLYSATVEGGARKDEYIHFEALLLKTAGGWKILMEYQKARATRKEWEALGASER